MVRAILDGRKTMTRRIVKMDGAKITDGKWGYSCFTPDGHISLRGNIDKRQHGEQFIKLKYKVGDILWVREMWAEYYDPHDYPFDPIFAYKADNNAKPKRWKPSIHMPKAACRLFLQITDVRVERLKDISEEDAIAEGVEQNRDGSWRDYIEPNQLPQDCARASFISLWMKINGPESWESNPWVWVVSFKQIEQP